jgi:hypothetical protein
LLPPFEISSLKSDLFEIGFNEVQIVVYVRDPASYHHSMVQQQIKALYRFSKPITFKDKVKEIIESWSAAFPRSRISVRSFDRDKLVARCVFLDFLAVVTDQMMVV